MRPLFHYTCKKNWMNDPNGLYQNNGVYHLYYQYNPYNDQWGNISWGHAVSKDLFHWKEEAVAISPDFTGDRDACFSGSALVVGDVVYYSYTGIRFNQSIVNAFGNKVPKDSRLMTSVQIMAKSSDGYHIEKDKKHLLLPPNDIIGAEFRDPKISKKKDCFYMIVAGAKEVVKSNHLQVEVNGNNPLTDVGGDCKQIGGFLTYESKDFKNWELKNQYFNESLGIMTECPDFFEMDGHDYLLFSSIGMDYNGDKDVLGYCSNTSNHKGYFDSIGQFKRLELGMNLYAIQTFVDESNRRIFVGWIKNHEPIQVIEEDKSYRYNGMMCIPREVTADNGVLYTYPVKELEAYRSLPLDIKEKMSFCDDEVLDFEIDLLHLSSGELEAHLSLLEINWKCKGEIINRFGIGISDIEVKEKVNSLVIRTDFDGKTRTYDQKVHLKDLPLSKIRIIKDRHVIECFIDMGVKSISEVYHQVADEVEIKVDGHLIEHINIHLLSK